MIGRSDDSSFDLCVPRPRYSPHSHLIYRDTEDESPES